MTTKTKTPTRSAYARRIAWINLFVASAFEIVFALATSKSRAFTQLWPSLVVVVAAIAGMYFLSKALKDLDVSVGYTVWVGIGSVGTVVLGAVLFGETLTPAKIACFVLIIGGVMGLKLADSRAARCAVHDRDT